jgi:hypothetical protein
MSNADMRVTGGCLCGAVRYEAAAPIHGSYCHCRMCQKGYGGFFQAVLKFEGSQFRYSQGHPKFYRSSSYARRGFCAECGSPIAFVYDGNPHVWILIGTLDHPEDWPLTKDASWGQSVHCFAESGIPWHRIEEGLPQIGEPTSGTTARLRSETAAIHAGSAADPD